MSFPARELCLRKHHSRSSGTYPSPQQRVAPLVAETGQKHGVIVALVRGSDMDPPTTPSGRLVMGVLGKVAQHEIDQKSDRQKTAQLQAARQGRRAGGRRPFGYDTHGMTINPEEAATIVEATATGLISSECGRSWPPATTP